MAKQLPRAFVRILGVFLFILFCINFSGCSGSSSSSTPSPSENSELSPAIVSPNIPPIKLPLSSSPRLSVTLTGVGKGTVQFGGNKCTKTAERITCFERFSKGTVVDLEAIPAEGYLFQGWRGGECKGTGKCSLPLSGDTQINAAFTMVPYASNQNGIGLSSRNVFLTTTDGKTNIKLTDNPNAYLLIDKIEFSPNGESILYRERTTDDTKIPSIITYSLHLIKLDFEGKKIEEIKLTETSDRVILSEPQWSKDGMQILYAVENQNFSNLEVLKFNDDQYQSFAIEKLTNVTQCFNRSPRWSSTDPSKIFFFSNCNLRNGKVADELEIFQLWTMQANPLELAPERLTENRIDLEVETAATIRDLIASEVGPNGLIFTTGNNALQQVWGFDFTTQSLSQLAASTNKNVYFFKPKWSEDHQKIFLLSNRDINAPYDPSILNSGKISNLWEMNLDGSDSAPLTFYSILNPWDLYDLKWVKSSSGEALLYFSTQFNVPYLGMIEADGSNQTNFIQFDSDQITSNF